MIIRSQKDNKSALSRKLGISRSSLYYQHKREVLDMVTKSKIDLVLSLHPAYGHKRIALELKLNKKRILRVMKKFKIKPYRRRLKKLVKKNDLNKSRSNFANLILNLPILYPNQVWCADFTYIRHKGKFLYLATIIDRYTREIVGHSTSSYHDRFLVINALLEGIRTQRLTPKIIHTDQGSEYDSIDFIELVQSQGIKVSMSTKASPWQNSYQESWYSRFKTEFGDTNRFETTGELLEEIYSQIHYYNTKRIHSSLKTNPHQFKLNHLTSNTIHKVS